MYLPPLQPVVNSQTYIYGDVEIHPTASIAAGVILQATPNSRIVIGADACIGMGVVLNAHDGVINVESGATLGAGVLIIGKSTIGANACVGTSTTIFNASVESMKVVTPGSILGDTTHHVELNSSTNGSATNKSKIQFSKIAASNTTPNDNSETVTVAQKSDPEKIPQHKNPTDIKSQTKEPVNHSFSNNSADPWVEEKKENQPIETVTTIQVEEVVKNIDTPEGIAIGKVYIDQLLVTLFPSKKSSNNL